MRNRGVPGYPFPMTHCVQFSSGIGLALLLAVSVAAQTIHGRESITLPSPPTAEATPVSDDYFGTKIVDSYRWLEDAKSPQTRAFIDAENAYTARYLKQAHIRPDVVDDLDALENVSETGAPIQRGDSYFFSRRLSGEQQSSIYVRHGWTGKDQRLLDPATISRDPNTSIGIFDVSRDGSVLAYSVKQGGADETVIKLFNVKTGKTLEDELPAARYFRPEFRAQWSQFLLRAQQQGWNAAVPACDRHARSRATR
jgi:prolyl oligopeptidase